MYWLPLAVFIVHMAEELPRFPAWATRHFGVTSTPWYVYSHVLLIAIAVAGGFWASSATQPGWPRIVGTALMVTLAMNGIFHAVTTILFREYSPGVITGTLVFFPATIVFLAHVSSNAHLSLTQIIFAVAIAMVLQALVIASLFLRMDITWGLRRRATGRSCTRP